MTDDPLNNEPIESSSPLQNGGQALPINTMGFEPPDMPSEALESSKNADIPVSLNNPNPENTPVLTETPEVEKPAESVSVEAENPKVEPISEPAQTPETRTAQIPVNEPLVKISLARELLVKARNMIQFRKRKKLDRVMTLFLKKSKITNDEVREFLHVSDATAERYLNTLEKENKIKQIGKTGKGVSYSRI
jgi:hypothetical protein